jgi:hypothetical protein
MNTTGTLEVGVDTVKTAAYDREIVITSAKQAV